MIDPERWYEYEKNYQKYGFDMKPRPEPEKRERKAQRTAVSAGDKKKIAMSAVLILGIAMIMMIIITAYSANIRYDINAMIKENNALEGEIENLEAQLYTKNNINFVEDKAIHSLGMAYPAAGSKVFISADDVPAEGFGDVLKEKAYK